MTIVGARPTREEPCRGRNGKLLVALPEPGLSMAQDEEWCVVRDHGEWRQIRFHDYHQLYTIPGLYETLFYKILRCDSPRTVRSLLEAELAAAETPVAELRALDLGAGNGMVGEELADMGAKLVVGVDIAEEAAEATERDRPGVYDDYHVLDMANLDKKQRSELASYRFNAMTCVAALGFGDIPTQAFAAAYNLIRPQGWIAFNIKEDFLSGKDTSGFSRFIKTITDRDILSIRARRRYRHRLATNGTPLFYIAMVGIKERDIDTDLLV